MNIFITGTDTDVGKTVVTTGMAAAVKSLGYSVGVFKPVQSGAIEINGDLISPDLEFVKSVDSEILTKASYVFKEPVAPSLAADLAGVEIDLDKIKDDFNELKNKCDIVIVEGAGGLSAPVKNNFLMSDLAKMLDLPLLIVARPDLGTINHTLLTTESAKNKNIKILGIIISGYPLETEDTAIKNAPGMIEQLSGEIILGLLPKIENLHNNPVVLKEMTLKHINLDFIIK